MNVYAPELWPRKVRHIGFNPEREAFLRANVGVDPALLAKSMGLAECFVRQYQRKIGVRALSGYIPKRCAEG